MDLQMQAYARDNYDVSNRRGLPLAAATSTHLTDNCFMLRRNTPLVALHGCVWWNEIANPAYYARDQLSFGYVTSKMRSLFPQLRFSFFPFSRVVDTFLVVADPLIENLLQSAKYSKTQVNYLKRRLARISDRIDEMKL